MNEILNGLVQILLLGKYTSWKRQIAALFITGDFKFSGNKTSSSLLKLILLSFSFVSAFSSPLKLKHILAILIITESI